MKQELLENDDWDKRARSRSSIWGVFQGQGPPGTAFPGSLADVSPRHLGRLAISTVSFGQRMRAKNCGSDLDLEAGTVY